jgi:hypothetical protein
MSGNIGMHLNDIIAIVPRRLMSEIEVHLEEVAFKYQLITPYHFSEVVLMRFPQLFHQISYN